MNDDMREEYDFSRGERGRYAKRYARGRKFILDELIDGITEENKHEETDTGPPTGKEIW
jgi:antitoxin component of MazEF toxin-antitoxin module